MQKFSFFSVLVSETLCVAQFYRFHNTPRIDLRVTQACETPQP
jgi:hypothetical protein